MSSEKSVAIVLRVVEFSETSVIVTLFTRDFGKISALAKGARRPKSPFESALDLLAVCRIVFLQKKSDALDLLTEAKLERRFRAATRNLSCLYAGFYVAELLRELTDSGDPHPELFQAADQALYEFDHGQNESLTVIRFELTALRLLGHVPSFDRCVGCGEEMELSGRVAFGLLSGGVLCGRCRGGRRQVASISAGSLLTMRRLAHEPDDEWRSLALDVRQFGEIRGLLTRYMTNLLGKRMRMHPYLQTGISTATTV